MLFSYHSFLLFSFQTKGLIFIFGVANSSSHLLSSLCLWLLYTKPGLPCPVVNPSSSRWGPFCSLWHTWLLVHFPHFAFSLTRFLWAAPHQALLFFRSSLFISHVFFLVCLFYQHTLGNPLVNSWSSFSLNDVLKLARTPSGHLDKHLIIYLTYLFRYLDIFYIQLLIPTCPSFNALPLCNWKKP